MTQKESRFKGDVTASRRKIISKIKGKDTSIELALRKALLNRVYRYRKNFRELPGTPDIALTKYKIAYFEIVNFFMARTGSVLKKLEKVKNPEYRVAEIQRNIDRDREKTNIKLHGMDSNQFLGEGYFERPRKLCRYHRGNYF